jgi:hypothetical protein
LQGISPWRGYHQDQWLVGLGRMSVRVLSAVALISHLEQRAVATCRQFSAEASILKSPLHNEFYRVNIPGH